ncbi:DUF4876 domain-containing protein [uncultured Alistipes sp.]|jgi:hypothetical protein|uniref:DUF4876 domain-containing protein n=1 Tax=uncultured Alistipes sp. TaxID=538949 RepID=UPI0025D46C5B|nr:DUF4876 domain-containing protein [uncultured Alistipes sp.]
MRKLFYILACVSAVACTSFDKGNPYDDELMSLEVSLVYPGEYANYRRAGVEIELSSLSSTNMYTAQTDDLGRVSFRVTKGNYTLAVQDEPGGRVVFNGAVDQLLVLGDVAAEVILTYALSSPIVIKEAYFGGCPALPAEGTYNRDKYIILHNNGPEMEYLDNICVGMVDPYNSQGASGNYWLEAGKFRTYASVPDCVWQLPGSGTDFPIPPGEDAVISFNGAVDHTQTYPMSVNLNNRAYYVCYDTDAYNQPNSVLYHPAPGDQILSSHHFKVIKKTGTLTSHTSAISQTSPAMIVYRAPEGVDLAAYLADDSQSVIGRGSLNYTKIPWAWVIDGMEVVYRGSSVRNKRLPTNIDVRGVEFSSSYLGHTVHRYLDEEATQEAGYEVYADTNNSSKDFYERSSQSLRQ